MPSILKDTPFPFDDPAGQELHITLARQNPTVPAAVMLAERAGIDVLYLNQQQPPIFVWHDILLLAAQNRQTRALVEAARAAMRDDHPSSRFLDDVLAERPSVTDTEPRRPDGTGAFVKGDDRVSELEALLFHDDLMIQIGRVPALIATLQRLIVLAPSVCRMVVDTHGRSSHGSGFRIAPDLLLTNWHVVHHAKSGLRATTVTAEFGYEDDGQGGVLTGTPVPCDVDSIVSDQADDWAVIRPKDTLDDAWPVVPLSAAVEPEVEEPAFIVQHPGGERKRLGYVRNTVSSFDDRVLHYLTDTQPGSSGSPVFDAGGGLIGLHHAGGSPQQVVGAPPLSKNEGIRIPRVVAGLQAQGIAVP